jgi:hypothetical protein
MTVIPQSKNGCKNTYKLWEPKMILAAYIKKRCAEFCSAHLINTAIRFIYLQ